MPWAPPPEHLCDRRIDWLTRSVYRVDDDEIEERCDALRKKLTAEQERDGRKAGPLKKGLKTYQVHELADAKIKESEKLRRALGISKTYEEGSHWKRQEERLQKSLDKDDIKVDKA